MNKVNFRVILICLSVYICVGYSALFSTLDQTPELFIMRLNPDGTSDIPMLIINGIFLFLMILHVAMCMFPYKQTMARIILDQDDLPLGLNFVVVLFGCIVIYLLSTQFTSILNLIGLIGAASQMIIIPLPAYACVKSRLAEEGGWNFKSVSITVLAAIITIVNLMSSFIGE